MHTQEPSTDHLSILFAALKSSSIMSFAPMARANSNSLVHHGLGATTTVVKPVFIHPSHGLNFSPVVGDEENMPDFAQLSMERSPVAPSPSSSISSLTEDYFWSSPSRDSESMYSISSISSSSSTMSTPTLESPYTKASPLSRTSSFQHLAQADAPSPSSPGFSAQLSFSSFSPVPSRPSSPPRGLPYARQPRPSTMVRSISSPVETQRQLERRTRALSNATDAVAGHAVNLARTQSAIGLGLGGASVGMSRAATSTHAFPTAQPSPFGEGWGSALPFPAYEAPPLVPFPYSLAHPARPTRPTRANSVAHLETTSAPLSPSITRQFVHRNSVPTTHSPFPPSSAASTPSSPVLTRPRRQTLVMTPILADADLPSLAETESFAEGIKQNTPPSPSVQLPPLHRGKSY